MPNVSTTTNKKRSLEDSENVTSISKRAKDVISSLADLDGPILNLINNNKLKAYVEAPKSHGVSISRNKIIIRLNSRDDCDRLLTWLRSPDFLSKVPSIARAQPIYKLYLVSVEYLEKEKEEMIKKQIEELGLKDLGYLNEIPSVNDRMDEYLIQYTESIPLKDLKSRIVKQNQLKDNDLEVIRTYKGFPHVAKIHLTKEHNKEKRLYLGLDLIELYRYIPVPMCMNCNQLNHTTDACSIPTPICGHCSNNHLTKVCESKSSVCINCLVRFKDIAKANHYASYMMCPTRIDVMDHLAKGGSLA